MYKIELLDSAEIFISKLNTKLQAKALQTIDLLEEFGPYLILPHSKKITGTDNLFELRVQQGNNICRIFYFNYKKKTYVLLSGFIKKQNKTKKMEILKALKLIDQYILIKKQRRKIMKNVNIRSYKNFLNEALKNKNLKKEYDLLEKEFIIAKEVIKLRKELNLTQKDLAKLAKTSQPAIARLESGSYKNLSLSFLNKIAKALGAKTEIHLRKAN